MDLPQLRAFVALADTRHFGRAAVRLHITQPALTKRLRALEATTGIRLFERDRTGAALTPAGGALLPDAIKITAEADALAARARNVAQGTEGRIDVGFGLSTIDIAPRMVATFRRAYPAVAVSLNDFSSTDQVERLESGRLDLGFIRLPTSSALIDSRLLGSDGLALAGPVTGSAMTSHADLEACNELGFVMLRRERGPGLRSQIDRWCAAQGFRPRITQTADDIQTVLALVVAGVGVSIVPRKAALLMGGGVELLPLAGAEAQSHIGAAWRRDVSNPALRHFLRLMDA